MFIQINMKILLLPSYFLPEGVSSPYISWNRNQAFVDQGWELVVYTPIPCRGISKEIREEYKSKKKELMLGGKMIVHRFSLIYESKNPFLRAIRYFVQNIKQFIRGVFAKDARKCDVMLIASTPPTQGAMAALIKKLTGRPFIYNLQDIFPDSLVGAGLSHKGSILWKIGRVIEDFTYKHADKIIVISESFKQNIIAKGVPEEKIEIVYNWVDQNAVMPVSKDENQLFEELGISRDKFHVVYAGNLGIAQNIDVIIDTAKEMISDKEVEFLIFGTGGLKEQYVDKVRILGIDNVKFFPLQPIERVSQVYSLGDVCIVSCKPGLGGAAMPSKTLSIMSAGRPVVASFDEGELTYILSRYNCGMYSPAGDVQSLVKVIRTMNSNRRMCNEMGRKARQLILNKFTREYGTQRYVEIIKSVVEKK